MTKLVDWQAIEDFRNRGLSPERPYLKGTAQNPDIYFQAREAANPFYDQVPDIVENYMAEITKLTNREYHPFNYYGAPDAERVIVAMGSVCETIEETVDYLLAQGEKVGIIKVHLYRPFSAKYFFRALPETVKKIAVLDRTKEPGAMGEPLYLDVRNLFYDQKDAPHCRWSLWSWFQRYNSGTNFSWSLLIYKQTRLKINLQLGLSMTLLTNLYRLKILSLLLRPELHVVNSGALALMVQLGLIKMH